MDNHKETLYTVLSNAQTDSEEPSEQGIQAGAHPCKLCNCPEFESGDWNSVTCKCGHDTKAHGLPF